MTISANDVKTLRERTGAGMMDCKRALEASKGNFEVAIDWLKKQGMAKAVKKGDRVAAEGLVFSKYEAGTAVLVELNCETDFVARNHDFKKLGDRLAGIVHKNHPAGVEDLLKLNSDHQAVAQMITGAVAVLGENIMVRRFCVFKAKESGRVFLYNHAGGRIAVLIEVAGERVTEEAGRNLAMQIAALSPQYLDKSQVPRDVLERERQIQLTQLESSGKPPQVVEKIVAGKLDKFSGELSLMQQIYVKDSQGKRRVEEYLKEVDPRARVVQFVRFAVGEGIERHKDDLAREVQKMVGQK